MRLESITISAEEQPVFWNFNQKYAEGADAQRKK